MTTISIKKYLIASYTYRFLLSAESWIILRD